MDMKKDVVYEVHYSYVNQSGNRISKNYQFTIEDNALEVARIARDSYKVVVTVLEKTVVFYPSTRDIRELCAVIARFDPPKDSIKKEEF